MKRDNFAFLDPGKLLDDELELVLVKRNPANPEKKYVPGYEFEMRHSETGEKMGNARLSIGYNENIHYGGHVGYNVLERFRGKRLAARSLNLIFPLAKHHGINPIWITFNPENIASRKTCEIAGGILQEIVDLPEHNEQYQDGDRKKCRYRFDL